MTMILKLLKLVKLPSGGLGKLAGLANFPTLAIGIALGLFAFGCYSGYSLSNKLWESKELKALKKETAAKEKFSKKISDLEKDLLVTKSERKVVYRDRIKKVPTYIDRDNCRVNDIGMRELADALRPSDRTK